MSAFPVSGSVPTNFKNHVSELLNETTETPNRVENPTAKQTVNETSEKTTTLVQDNLKKDTGPLGFQFTHPSIENLFQTYAVENPFFLNKESETPNRVENLTTEQTVNESSEKTRILAQENLTKDAGPLGFQFTHRSIENLFQTYASEKILFEAQKESKKPDSPLCKRDNIDLSNYSEDEKKLDFEKYKKLGNEAFNGQQWQEAIEAYSKAYELNEDDTDVNSHYALAYFKSGNSDGAYGVLMKKARKK